MKSKNFDKIKMYYLNNIWDINKLNNVVEKTLGITKEEYKEITGYEYPKNDESTF